MKKSTNNIISTRSNEIIDLVDYILDDGNPFNDTAEDIFIDDDLFDNTDNKDIKIEADDILGGIRARGNYVGSATTSNYTWKYKLKEQTVWSWLLHE